MVKAEPVYQYRSYKGPTVLAASNEKSVYVASYRIINIKHETSARNRICGRDDDSLLVPL